MNPDFFASVSVGTRVVVRYKLPPSDLSSTGETVTDALGYLEAIDEASVSIKTRTSIVLIERSLITHAKEVPPPPIRRRSAPR